MRSEIERILPGLVCAIIVLGHSGTANSATIFIDPGPPGETLIIFSRSFDDLRGTPLDGRPLSVDIIFTDNKKLRQTGFTFLGADEVRASLLFGVDPEPPFLINFTLIPRTMVFMPDDSGEIVIKSLHFDFGEPVVEGSSLDIGNLLIQGAGFGGLRVEQPGGPTIPEPTAALPFALGFPVVICRAARQSRHPRMTP